MQQSRYVPMFCTKLTELLSKLEDRFPEEQDFGFLHTAIMWAVQGGQQETVVKEYHNYVYKYKDAINKKDENFFLENDYKSVIEGLESDAKEGKLKVDHFRKMFTSKRVTDNDKKNAWTYLSLLNKLIDGIIKNKEVDLS